jgi:predicted dehydrogenase
MFPMTNIKNVTLAQVGCGYWGPNLLRAFTSIPNCKVKYLADGSAERRAFATAAYPGISVVPDIKPLLRDPEVDALIIATPASTHFDLAKQALEAGKHIFVEKPLATSVAEIDVISHLAGLKQLKVMVGHTFIYNEAVRYVKQIIDRGDLGEIRYIYGQRLNLGRIRSDIDAMWNLAPHDVSIVQYWLNDPEPVSIIRSGMAYVQDGIDDVVFLNIVYPNKVMVNLHVSWLDPQKVRKMIVVGAKKMVVYDDVADTKVSIYDKGIDRKAVLGENMDYDLPVVNFSYRSGDIVLPNLNNAEPLRTQARHFVECLLNGSEPLTGIPHARKVVEILERAAN